MTQERNTLFCSFCGKPQDEVRKLIAGPTVFICNECVILCFDILVEEKHLPANELSREQNLLRREARLTDIVKLLTNVLTSEEERQRRFARVQEELRKFTEAGAASLQLGQNKEKSNSH